MLRKQLVATIAPLVALVFLTTVFLSILHFCAVGLHGHYIETCPLAFLEDKNLGAVGQHISLTQHLTTAIPSVFGLTIIFILLFALRSAERFILKKLEGQIIPVPRISDWAPFPPQLQELFASGLLHSKSY